MLRSVDTACFAARSSLRGGLVGALLLVGSAGCSVYDTSLLGGGGAAGSTTNASGSSSSGEETSSSTGGMACTTPAQCPGMDGECGTRTCDGGVCGIDAVTAGTELANQTAGDCKKNVCDGAGLAAVEADPTDPPNDAKECTNDTCVDSTPMSIPKNDTTPCTQGGGKVCFEGDCVACIGNGDCASNVCTMQHTCGAATCTDMAKNGTESDVDCGGSCSKCPNGKTCNSANDCLSSACNVTCQASCTDLMMNGTETDVDCGGSCPACAIALGCLVDGDCASGDCGVNSKCACNGTQLLISEVRPTGPTGGSDDFVELYNPTNATISLSGYTVEARSSTAGSYGLRWTGSAAEMLGPGKHYLIVGSGYSDAAVPGDASLASGVGDKGSVILKQGSTVIDALCYWYGTTSPNFMGYTCEGVPFKKASDLASAERKLGAAMGNCTDTGDSTSDFISNVTSTQQNMASAATP